MKTGAEDKKKVVILAGLGLLAVYLVYSNFIAGSPGTTLPPTAAAPAPSIPSTAAEPSRTTVPRAARNAGDEFHPVLHSKRPEDQIDPNTVDPTLQLDRLAKLQEVPAAGGGRNLFQFSTAPPPKVEAQLPQGPEPNIKPVMGPTLFIPHPPPVEAAGPPPPPPLPPVNFKYYGFATVRRDGKQTAFFLDGEDILVKTVGDIVKGNYRLVRIGQNSAVVEDTPSKRQQTVQLAEEAQGD